MSRTPRDRILEAALECFAHKGYAATTIADIEQAAGYEPRTGGLYRHFASKAAIFEAVIDQELDRNRAAVVDVRPPPPRATRRELLEQVILRALQQLDTQRRLARLINRDLDRFPEILERVRVDMTETVYGTLAAALPRSIDREAFAVLVSGAAVDFKLKQFLYGRAPLDVSDQRFAAVWVDVADTYLTERSGPKKKEPTT